MSGGVTYARRIVSMSLHAGAYRVKRSNSGWRFTFNDIRGCYSDMARNSADPLLIKSGAVKEQRSSKSEVARPIPTRHHLMERSY